MNILLITFIYNELPYLGDFVTYYKNQGIDLYVIDNYSNDGSYEWLIANNIECSRFDTNESFELFVLQSEVERILKIKKPDWFVYAHPDLFYVFKDTVRKTIEDADKKGFNQLKVRCYGALNINEKRGLPLYHHYFYGNYYRYLIMISKYDDTVKMNGDSIKIKDAKPYQLDGIMCNYGACKPEKEQRIKLKRREKAWDNGLSRNIGKHFKKYEDINWIWKREDVINFHHSVDAKYFKKLYREG